MGAGLVGLDADGLATGRDCVVELARSRQAGPEDGVGVGEVG